jgi:protease-4
METPPTSRLSRFSKVLLVLGFVAAIAFFGMVSSLAGMVGRLSPSGAKGKKEHLTQLTVSGPIFESERYLSIIDGIADDAQCKGLLLRIESPGGAVGSSQEIYAALKRLRGKGLPLVVSFGNVAASGGYYVALAGERIFANPGTLTGSIGVLFQFPEAGGLLEKVGVSLQTVKSGDLKDIGNPSRKPTARELAYLQHVIDDTYSQFLADVASNRRLHPDSVRPVADGRVLTGRQALAKGLVDTLGGLDAAKRETIRRAKVPEDVDWVLEPKPKSRLERFLDPESQVSTWEQWLSGVRERLSPGAFFLWR